MYVLKDSVWIVLAFCVNRNMHCNFLSTTYEYEVDVLKALLEWVLHN